MPLTYLPLEKTVVIRGLANYKDIAIELLLCGLHNAGNLAYEAPSRGIVAFKDGTFAIINIDDHAEKLIAEGFIADCAYDKDLFLETVKNYILKL